MYSDVRTRSWHFTSASVGPPTTGVQSAPPQPRQDEKRRPLPAFFVSAMLAACAALGARQHGAVMPVVFRHRGFRFFFYSNEGDPREPVHVHVTKDGIDAKFWVSPPRLARNDGFDARTLIDLLRVVEDNAELIGRAWHEHFG